jgi:hypothetical protein
MAYVSKEFKQERAPLIRKLLKEFNMKGSVSVRNHSTLVVKLRSGELDIIKAFDDTRGYFDVNHYWVDKSCKDDTVKDFMTQLIEIMYGPDYFDDSDIMTDYFHVSHYINISVGQYDKPYLFTPA